jgi:hypothetical protein
MKRFYEKLKEELAKFIAQILITAVLILAMLIPKDAIRSIDPLIWFWLVVVLVIACIALSAYIFAKRPKYVLIPL